MKIQYEGTDGLRDKERDRWNYEGTDNSQGSGLNPVGSEMLTTRDLRLNPNPCGWGRI
jgi:hypothetical protein